METYQIVLLVIGCLFLYVFIGRIVYNISLCKESMEFTNTDMESAAAIWILYIPFLLIVGLIFVVFELADLISDPKNYKFRIKFEKKG